jgi:hypothetical protein
VSRLPLTQTTEIDRFDVTNPDQTTFVASGEVPGYLLNQYSLSEWNGDLRVATTSEPPFWDGTTQRIPASQSSVTVLGTSGQHLVPVGRLPGLGAGQRIYSVRFVDGAGYVVTFRQVDPLYVLDLTDPTAPKVTGQLELKGYSSYLFPIGSGLLLGIGQDVGAGATEPAGAQLELFDVSDPAAPRLLQKAPLGQYSFTQVQNDPHAFLYWAPTSLAVLPLDVAPAVPPAPGPGQGGQGSTGFTGAVAFRIDPSGIAQLARIKHPAIQGYPPEINRSLVIGSELYTVSSEGILASTLNTLAPGTFVKFPQPPPPPPVAAGAPTPAGAPTHAGRQRSPSSRTTLPSTSR